MNNGVQSFLDRQPSYGGYYELGPTTSELASYKRQGFNRPTPSWKLECEEKGYTRLNAYEAVMTDLKLDSRTDNLNTIGKWMLILFCISFVGHFVLPAAPVCHCCMHMCYIIMAPFVLVITKAELEYNRENKSKLDRFSVFAECADDYTFMDIAVVEEAYDVAYTSTQKIQAWLLVTVILFVAECLFLCCVPCVPLCGKLCGDDGVLPP